jgi:hypothetical protein
MRRTYIIIILILLSFVVKAQVYQSMPQAGYGPVKRFLIDSVLTIPTGISSLRNISGGRDTGQIRYNKSDSTTYVYSGTQWNKVGSLIDTVSLSNRINGKLNISDTGSMLSPYLRKKDTVSLSNRINLKLNISDTSSMLSNYRTAINGRVKYTDTASMLAPYLKSAVTSVGLSMPVAFSVANTPVTSTGTLAVTAVGTAAQYIRGDGQLATLPSGASGGSSVDYYFNGGTSQGTIGGSTYYEMSKNAVIGTSVDFSRTNAEGNGLISQFITDANDPNRTEIPAGAWNFELFFNASSSGGSPSYYVELLKYDGSTFTSIASGSAIPELITSGTSIDLYLTSLAVPYTTLLITDRLVIRIYVVTSGRTITLHTQNGHLCLVTTTFAGGVSSLNGLTANTQYLSVGTAGTDFAINSLTDTHTFNLPTASATNRGALSSANWTTFNNKLSTTTAASTYVPYTGATTAVNLGSQTLSSGAITSTGASSFGSGTAINTGTSGITLPLATQAYGTIAFGNNSSGTAAPTISSKSNDNTGLSIIAQANDVNTYDMSFTAAQNDYTDFSTLTNTAFLFSRYTTPLLSILRNGVTTFSNLSGSGNRMVIAGSSGTLSTQAIPSGTVTSVAALTLGTTGTDLSSTVANGTTTPVITLNVPTASATNRGVLSSANWSTFNGKMNFSDTALMLSNYQTAINQRLKISDTASMLSGYQTAINLKLKVADTASMLSNYQTAINQRLKISDTASMLSGRFAKDTVSLSNRINLKVTSVSGTSPIVSSGGTTPAISIPAATTSVNGYLTSTDWTTFNNKAAALSGTINTIPKFNTISTIGNSNITDNGSLVSLNSITNVNSSLGILANQPAGGPILTLSIGNGGSGYVDGSYTVTFPPSTSLYGSATLVVSGGIVTTATLIYGGANYYAGETKSIPNTSLGGTGSGCVITIATVDDSNLRIQNAFGTSTASSDISLYHFNASTLANEGLGFLKWETNDASTGAAGIQAKFGAYSAGGIGNAYFTFETKEAGGAVTERTRIGSDGAIGIGATSLTGYSLRASKNISGATTSYGFMNDGVVQTGVTVNAIGYSTNLSTVASAFTNANLTHYQASQSTIGATSIVTNQFGFSANANLIGATNNYGFYGNIPTAANRWNLYMSGTASNYLAGNLLIGNSTDNGSGSKLQVTGNVSLTTAGNKLLIATGTNATAGTATLVSGTVTVATSAVTANSIILITVQESGVITGVTRVSARTTGTSFVITSSVLTDTASVGWLIIN